MQGGQGPPLPSLDALAARRARIDEVEQLVAVYTAGHTRAEVARALQAAGIEAVVLPAFALRLRRREPERYAGLRTLARD